VLLSWICRPSARRSRAKGRQSERETLQKTTQGTRQHNVSPVTRCWEPGSTATAGKVSVPVLPLWQLLHALHHAGGENFRTSMLGPGGETAVRSFFAETLICKGCDTGAQICLQHDCRKSRTCLSGAVGSDLGIP
jgi:hypothetical protein